MIIICSSRSKYYSMEWIQSTSIIHRLCVIKMYTSLSLHLHSLLFFCCRTRSKRISALFFFCFVLHPSSISRNSHLSLALWKIKSIINERKKKTKANQTLWNDRIKAKKTRKSWNVHDIKSSDIVYSILKINGSYKYCVWSKIRCDKGHTVNIQPANVSAEKFTIVCSKIARRARD